MKAVDISIIVIGISINRNRCCASRNSNLDNGNGYLANGNRCFSSDNRKLDNGYRCSIMEIVIKIMEISILIVEIDI